MNLRTTALRRGQRRTLVCAAILAALSTGSLASHVGEELEADQQTVAATDQLLGALQQFDRMPEAQRASMLQRLTQLATQRRDRMLALLERNPKLAAMRVLPAAVRNRLPAQVRALVEQEVAVDGTVVATIGDDFARGRSQQRFHVLDAAGQRLELRIADASERELLAMVSKRASVAAMQLDRQLLVLDKRAVKLAAGGSTTTQATTVAATNVIQGDQSTLVITANFSDKALPCTTSDLQSRLFGTGSSTLDQGYRQSSGNLVSFSGQVIGPFPIAFASIDSCDYNAWASALNSAALAAGINPSTYKRVSYVTPSNINCGWSGLATLGGSQPTPSWIQACTATGVFSHELGHNLMFHHAATPSAEYGDGSDPMGGAKLVQSNAANRVMAGWLGASQVQDVSNGGSYAIAAIESAAATSPQVLRMVKADTAEYYYVSLRQPTGVDANLSATYYNAITVHRSTGTLPAKTYLLATLAVGQSWSDSVNGIQMTYQALSGSTASVGVGFGGTACTRQPPTVAVAPASQSSAPGATLGYTLTVTNNNSSACPSASFNLAQTLPAGFSGGLGASSVTLAAGASTSVGWNVASPATSADAAYTLTATASEAAVSNSADAHASYVVTAPPNDTTPPSIAIASPAPGSTLSGRTTTIAANASDASGVQAVEFYVDGKLIATDSSAPYSVNWNLRKASKGVHSIRARAIDVNGNAAEQTISVSVN